LYNKNKYNLEKELLVIFSKKEPRFSAHFVDMFFDGWWERTEKREMIRWEETVDLRAEIETGKKLR
jgi:hypothetical protein